MCTLDESLELPKFAKSNGNNFKSNITLFMKPCEGKDFYRFRLLKFSRPDKNDRDYPFIERYVHDHWAENENHVKLPDDTITCLRTKFVPYRGNRFADCPMCQKANENMAIWKASGFKDSVAASKFNAMKAKFQGVIPVYVVNDPNNPKNNEHMKCILFTEKKVDRSSKKFPEELNNPDYILSYDEFVAAINAKIAAMRAAGTSGTIWNTNAVDLCVKVRPIEITLNKGTPKEYKYTKKVITKMTFTKEAYPIEGINQSAIEKFDFDDQYYVKNTLDEIEAFANKNYGSIASNIPDEDIDMGDDDDIPVPEQVENNDVVNTTTKQPEMKIDDIPDIDDTPEVKQESLTSSEVSQPASTTSIPTDASVNALIDDMDDLI